ncbi:hypothetical protein HYV89_03420 [Candidatus Woesearchaeota archaeon]|nr:hypothetical protein [Candidatus Woesearchaeota archaeon]
MTKEIRTESGGLFGVDKQVIYEDGIRVGEVRHETEGFFSERPVDKTYDNEGNLVSETRQEAGGFLGGDAKRIVYEKRSQKEDLTGIVNNSSSSGYSDSGYHSPSLSSSSPGSSVNNTGCLIAVLGGIAFIAAPLATIGILVSLVVGSGSYMYDFYKNRGITRGPQSAEQTFDYYKPRAVEGTERLFESDNSPAKRNLTEYRSKRDSESLREPLKKRENKKSENIETRAYEPTSKRRETIKRPIETETPRKTSSVEAKEERVRVYGAVLPSSEFSQSTPKDYAPVVVRVEGADGNETIKAERRSKQDMEREISDDIGITYPVSGKRYAIERAKYPEFFDKLDLDRDRMVSLYELGEAQSTLYKITGKKKEGDLDAIVKEFLKKYKPKKNR